ncbi:hypothetical protein MINS_10600 [Mycolicibacterium insubricum]|jgi:class 3 adenylate cyclase|uniref:Adenylate/guanylate cyclase domain-containing protein n=1 Tax=Mycolicibacterium insubricum TaxID=444597 RepID=A0A1X0DAY1_9MYCO|nr:adenylate/guanylate cyclase domain-containing protein [Mycolicibacterium insubricum]MCB0928466.1 adenylate/guanylate cyclase domain-containing protein [Mycobacterium sp.]MCB9440692.1 adenylate/guanylate cyclase domain-containing protein [Mycolicibacterium sp.]ORA69527.1 adenylate/guanylate cyclase domain-containing protein [Mycolicibacterium insubricum]BBZ65631.1 hypothetical protein MINS_10600 [Mycolicibacterium insubricum]
MDVPVGWLIAAGVLAVAAVAAIITLTVLLSVSRGQLTSTRRDLADLRERQGKRRRKLGVAPLAVRTVWQTADSLLNKGIVSTVRNSIEDLAGWAQVERPDLARLTADGDVTIAFSDIEGSTQLNEALGDREWVKILERHNKLVGRCVDDHGGHIVKSQGDGFMMAFGDPREALECAEEIQADLGSDRVLASGEHPIRVRMGIHHGRSVRRGDDLFGRNVAMAARVAAQARGGEILVSADVHNAVAGDPEFRFGAPRAVTLKGISGEQELFPVLMPRALEAAE